MCKKLTKDGAGGIKSINGGGTFENPRESE